MSLSKENFDELVARGHERRRTGDKFGSLAAFEAAHELQPTHLGAQMEVVNGLRDLGRLAEAAAVAQQATERHPRDPAPYIKLGIIKRATTDHVAALAAFEAAISLAPDHPGAHLELVNELRRLGQNQQADIVLEDIGRRRPDNAGVQAAIGMMKRRQGDRRESLAFFRSAASIDPNFIGAHLEMASDLRELKEFDDAESILRELLNRHPKNSAAWVGIALTARSRGDHEAALQAFAAAKALDPTNAQIKIETATALKKLNKLSDAESIYLSILQSDAKHFAATIGLAQVKNSQMNRSESLSLFRRAELISPQRTDIQLEIGHLLRQLGQLNEAAAIFERILELESHNLVAYIRLAHVKRDQKDRIGSLSTLETATKFAPQNPRLQLEIATDLRELNRLDEAETVLSTLLKQHPENVDALIGLGHVKRRQKLPAASLAAFEAAVELDPDRPQIKLEVAAELRSLDLINEAEAVVEAILAVDTRNVAALIASGYIKRQKGDRTASLTQFERAAAHDTRHVGARIEIATDLRELGRFKEAEQSLILALQIDPCHAQTHAQYGLLLRRRGDTQKALLELESAASYAPENIRFRIEMALAHRELGNSAKAEAILTKIVDENPKDVSARSALSTLFMEFYRLDEAEQLLTSAPFVDSSVESYLALARLYRRKGDRARALEFFEKAIEISPKNISAFSEIVEEHRARGDFAKAHRLSAALREIDSSMISLLQQGRIFRDEGQHRQALEIFSEAARQFPENWQPQLEMAIEYRLLGEPVLSGDLLSSILKNDERNLAALDQIVEHFRFAEELDDALLACHKAIEIRPNLLWPYLKAAQVYARMGKIDFAWSSLDSATHLAGHHPQITATRIELIRLIREFSEAEDFYKNLPAEHLKDFSILAQGIHCALAVGNLDFAQEQVERLDAQTLSESSAITLLRGKISEALWDHPSAIKHHEAALRINPRNAAAYWNLAKCSLLTLQPAAARSHLKTFLQLNVSANLLKGSPHNISQNHMGQMIDEYLLDVGLLSELQSLDKIDEEETKLQRLYDIVRENPDHTPSSITLLLSLRRRGSLGMDMRFGASPIPKTIVQFWDSPNLPDELRDLTLTWPRQNPGHTYQLFNEASAAVFLSDNHAPQTITAFRRSSNPAQQADIFRLAYLASHGGFYADCDDRCSTGLDSFIPAKADFVSYQEEYGTLGNNFIGAAANHPVICRALDMAVEAVNRDDRDMVWFSTGPGLLTRAFALAVAETPSSRLAQSAIFTVGRIQRYLGMHCPVTYKSTNKHWLRSAFRSKPKPVQAIISSNS